MSDGTTDFDLKINQSATYERIFFWYQGLGCRPIGLPFGLPVDLTGWIATMQIRPYSLSNVVYYDASADITLGGIFGTITLNIPAWKTKGFTWWNGVYDMYLQSPGGQVIRFLSGNVDISAAVTNYPDFTADSDTGADSSITVG